MNKDNKKKNKALFYAEKLKWHVLPVHSIVDGQCTCGKVDCKYEGKHPISTKGLLDATTDLEILTKWWDAHPYANVGVRTGSVSGFFALDIDPRHGGEESLDDLEKEYGKIPHTIEALTGGGGKHLLFKYPQKTEIKNKVGIKPGLDIRGEGGYIVVEPSIHKSGNEYCWEHSSQPLEIPLSEAPAWLITLINSNTIKQKQSENTNAFILEGQRNDTLTRLTGSLHRSKMSREAILSAIRAENNQKCQPPLLDSEVIKIVDSITMYPNNTVHKKNDKIINKDPALLIYPKDIIVTCSLLNNEQCGLYLKFICYQHQFGHLSEQQVKQICGTLDKDMLELIKEDDNNCFYVEWVDTEKKRRSEFSESRRNNRLGKKK